jgi:hypothetical protein
MKEAVPAKVDTKTKISLEIIDVRATGDRRSQSAMVPRD